MQFPSSLPSPSPTRSSFLGSDNDSSRFKLRELENEIITLELTRQASKYQPTSFGELEGFKHLTAGEHFWRNHQLFLKEHGYELRPRYHFDWVPSWFETKKDPMRCKDGETLRNSQIIDAIRVLDGTEVVLKQLVRSTKSNELDVLRLLSAESLRTDSRNHCVPIMEIFDARHATDTVILVMPKFQHLYHCQFKTAVDVLELFRQIIEGFEFLHQRGIAHGDCHWMNILSSHRSKTRPFFNHNSRLPMPSIKKELRSKLPQSPSSTQYYIIGFGSAKCFYEQELPPPSQKILLEWQRGDPAAEKNPFSLDTYRIGQLIQKEFCEVYVNFKFLESLVWDMVHPVPAKRPTVSQVALRFKQEMSKLPEEHHDMLLVNRTEHPIIHVLRETRELARSASRLRRHSTSHRTTLCRTSSYSPPASNSEERLFTSTRGRKRATSLLNRMETSHEGHIATTHLKAITSSNVNKPLPSLPSEESDSFITISVLEMARGKQSSGGSRRRLRKCVPRSSEIEETVQITIEHNVRRDPEIGIVVSSHGLRGPSQRTLVTRDAQPVKFTGRYDPDTSLSHLTNYFSSAQ